MKDNRTSSACRYIVLPIDQHAPRRRLCFWEGETLLWDLHVPLALQEPRRYAYVDITHFGEKGVTVTTDPPVELSFSFADAYPPAWGADEPYRPLVHFTARYGWINDPNGLVYVDGIYHMFFQHNPTDSAWENMTWGHAVSSDLLHWTQLDSALIPDRLGTMFSGSGIIDHANASGLGTAEEPPVLFYYTAAGGCSLLSAGQPATQCLAYSTDGGMTLRKYDGNPIIPHIIGGNRDPKAVFCEELGCHLVALYMDGHEYALFTSDDLLHFCELQRIPLAGDAECPDFYPLEVEGEPGNRKWVFSGASDRYLVGEFREGRFCVLQESTPYGLGKDNRSYAAQTFSDVEGRRIKLAWERLHAPEACFDSQMSIPMEVTLCRVGDKYRLRTRPCRELASLAESRTAYPLTDRALTLPLKPQAHDVTLTLDRCSPAVRLCLFGHTLTVDPAGHTLSFGEDTIPLGYTDAPACVRILVDTLGCEIFADDGLVYTVTEGLADWSRATLTVTSLEPTARLCGELTVSPLRSIH